MPSASIHSIATAQVPRQEPESVELSVVMPCLNEAETLEACILEAQRALLEACIPGEIIAADNGSTDGSPEIAKRLGAKVVHVTARGYGNALMGGANCARMVNNHSADPWSAGRCST